MTLFKQGDRIEYVGNSQGRYMTRSNVGRVGVVTKTQHPNDDAVDIRFDDDAHPKAPSVYASNIRKIDVEVSESVTDVFERYVSEFDKIVKDGTSVPRFTALGFLYSFANDMANAVPEE